MKRYELAKKAGLNWQVVLIQDLETDIKTITLEAVRNNVRFDIVDKKISRLIDDELKVVESDTIRENARQALLKFASRMYFNWLSIFGNKTLAVAVMAGLASKGVTIPPQVKYRLNSLPPLKDVKTRFEAPDYVYNRATPNQTFDDEYEKTIIERVNNTLSEQAKEDYSARYSLRASAERQVREEWQQQQLENLKDKGVNLVWIEEHANCSERCEPYQGKLYSLDHTSGTINGITYQPLEVATDVYYITKTGKRYKNGCISGFNCRHRLKPYTKGSIPDKIPADVLVRQRAIETRQRELERNVRQYEVLELGYKKLGNTIIKRTKHGDITAKDLYRRYKGYRKKWTDIYIKYSEQKKVPYYPSRLDI